MAFERLSISSGASFMLLDAFQEPNKEVYIQFRLDEGSFNITRPHANSKTIEVLIRDLLFAVYCAMVAHSSENIITVYH